MAKKRRGFACLAVNRSEDDDIDSITCNMESPPSRPVPQLSRSSTPMSVPQEAPLDLSMCDMEEEEAISSTPPAIPAPSRPQEPTSIQVTIPPPQLYVMQQPRTPQILDDSTSELDVSTSAPLQLDGFRVPAEHPATDGSRLVIGESDSVIEESSNEVSSDEYQHKKAHSAHADVDLEVVDVDDDEPPSQLPLLQDGHESNSSSYTEEQRMPSQIDESSENPVAASSDGTPRTQSTGPIASPRYDLPPTPPRPMVGIVQPPPKPVHSLPAMPVPPPLPPKTQNRSVPVPSRAQEKSSSARLPAPPPPPPPPPKQPVDPKKVNTQRVQAPASARSAATRMPPPPPPSSARMATTPRSNPPPLPPLPSHSSQSQRPPPAVRAPKRATQSTHAQSGAVPVHRVDLTTATK